MRWINLWSERIELYAAELRTGRSLVEAVAIDERLTQLRMITGNDESAREVLDMAIELAMVGARSEDIAPMTRHWLTDSLRTQFALSQIRNSVDQAIRDLQAEGNQ